MKFVDNILNAMSLGDNTEDDYDEDYYEEDEPVVEKAKKLPELDEDDFEDEVQDIKKSKPVQQKVTPIRQVKRAPGNGMEVCVIKPSSVEDAREITDTLLANRTVVLNLEGLDVETGQRILDFASGSTHAIHGNLQKISNFIFIITPACVDVSGDFQELFSGTFDVPISHEVI